MYELEQQVLQNPFVENATVYVTPKGLLKTYIKQREPLVRLVDSNGSYYVDKFGTVMPMSSNYSARVPLVFNISKPEDIEKVKKLMLFVQKDDFLNKEIVGIQRQGRDFLLEVRSGDYKVNIGDIVNLDIKFKKLKAFYNKALLDKTIEKYKVINIKYHNQVVCEK
ncbi:MAG: cell division protein FtsQ [Polaribacter sp.]|nr:MAG: cell division protein FtsQ [Polaribacter sp.]